MLIVVIMSKMNQIFYWFFKYGFEKKAIYIFPCSLGLTIITKLTSHIMVLLIVVKLTFQIQKPWMLGLVQSCFLNLYIEVWCASLVSTIYM